MGIPIDLSHKKFGRLTAMYPLPKRISRKIVWMCQCECGTTAKVVSSNLKRGNTKSCGCISREILTLRNMSHGSSSSYTYKKWNNMKTRCLNQNRPGYKNYGGRGIGISKTWIDDFDAFLRDMGEAPNGYTLERMDNDQDYGPGNCIWATKKTQNRNRRNVFMDRMKVMRIREFAWAGIPRRDIAELFGISSSHCNNIIANRKWI